MIQYVKNANPEFTENDGNATNITWSLEENSGIALIVGAGNYEGNVGVNFTLDPEDPHRPTAVQKVKRTKKPAINTK